MARFAADDVRLERIAELKALYVDYRLGDRSLAASFFDALLANHLWWRRSRDGNCDGLYEYGTSPVGDGLYRGPSRGRVRPAAG